MTNPSLPIVAVTMGDGAGVGPEVVVPALLDAEVLGICNPVVIGDAKRLRLAAEIVGATADIVAVDSIGDAKRAPGRINVIDLGLIPDDLPLRPNPAEVETVLAFELSQLTDGYAMRRLVRRGIPIRTPTYEVGHHLIWGATARILSHFLERLERV